MKTFAFVICGLALVVACLKPAHAITYAMVPVGDAGNVADTNGYGAVDHPYAIGTYEVTISQYAAFLNAVAATDLYGLYNENMGLEPNVAGIAQDGVPGAYAYAVIGPSGTAPAGANSPGNRPVSYVSWFRAARFANWMSNGQPTGPQGAATTENGAYPLNGMNSGTTPAANAINPNTGLAPLFRLPTEDEWYKAAYYKSGGTNAGYWAYATRSDTDPGNAIGGLPNQANYKTGVYAVTGLPGLMTTQNYLTDVGAFTGSASSYGTFDQSGNVYEWNDLTGAASETRGLRGGGWRNFNALPLSSSWRVVDVAGGDYQHGFRLVSPVPEPSVAVVALGGLALAGHAVLRARPQR